jgi:hypothetical protein
MPLLFVALSSMLFGQNLLLNPGFEEHNKEAFAHTCKFIFRDSNKVKNGFATSNLSSAATHQFSSK